MLNTQGAPQTYSQVPGVLGLEVEVIGELGGSDDGNGAVCGVAGMPDGWEMNEHATPKLKGATGLQQAASTLAVDFD